MFFSKISQPESHPLLNTTTMPNNKKSTLKMIKGKDSIHPGSRKGTCLPLWAGSDPQPPSSLAFICERPSCNRRRRPRRTLDGESVSAAAGTLALTSQSTARTSLSTCSRVPRPSSSLPSGILCPKCSSSGTISASQSLLRSAGRGVLRPRSCWSLRS